MVIIGVSLDDGGSTIYIASLISTDAGVENGPKLDPYVFRTRREFAVFSAFWGGGHVAPRPRGEGGVAQLVRAVAS